MARTTNIWIAASDNDIDYVKSVIESGQHSPNDKDNNGYTPIHAAASYGHIELLKYLISKGGNINVTDEDGDTPLHSVEDADVARILVEEFKADWKLKNSEGQTPLQKFEEEEDEDEYPELIAYLKQLSGVSSVSNGVSTDSGAPQFVPKVEYQHMDVDQGPADQENRKKIEAIMQSENPEEGLQAFMEDIVRNQLGAQNDVDYDDHDRKRTRNN
ncbi:hypothetical protein DV451_004438 [Geotrichum candidum]|uniref:Uncharacterized protein n=1 Tax=Geotrichum candidum TaxID=1173061 RepID=A0A0J9X5I2_GEOCN|nr:hypothetical protein DV451_004438 [Geotrichum candidum]KAI9212913.1 hypothetical protein DS838_002235 [Geotrichum bryndzae]KAF5106343.1 hypothetical protein DV453_003995 [Geotrichum candidum]KAF5114443.1 hypothetical protein DV454_002946 [Geotrichum candidum]KAF5117736.1 hypothetical protein DV495_004979 [Geotrichum candidum]